MRDATKLDVYFTGDKTLFLIPLYQRKYAWKRKHCERLFADLLKVKSEGRQSHFFGSIVTIKASETEDDLLVIDGQQRITTISLLILAAIQAVHDGNMTCEKGEEYITDTKNKYLRAKYRKGDRQIKLRPIDKDRIAVINGVSKAYAMTGWRIGFMAGPEWLVKACNKLQGQYTSGTCSVAQKAAQVAFDGPQDDVEKMRKVFEKRRDLIVSLAKEVPGFEVNNPQGAFYLFPKCDYYFGKRYGDKVINSAEDLAMYLLEVGHVATVGGTAFGSPECIRFSYATSEEKIKEAFRRVKEALAALK